jgi:guanyl-specific ribonuclease Sa
MLKNWFKAAAIAVFLVNAASVFAGAPEVKEQPKPSAFQELSGGFILDGFDALPSPEEIRIPEAAQERVDGDDKANGPAPAPGKDFTPVIKDQARIKAIMQLVSDIYNRNHLPYSQDGSTFKNKEGRLPAQPAGFYKEYTLLTGSAPHTVVIGGTTYQVAPDLSARGSERLIIGGGEKIYYTPDHYKNFILLTVVY